LFVFHWPEKGHGNFIVDPLENDFQRHPDIYVLRLAINNVSCKVEVGSFIIFHQCHNVRATDGKNRAKVPPYASPGKQSGLAGKRLPFNIWRMAKRTAPTRVKMILMTLPASGETYLTLTCSLPESCPFTKFYVGKRSLCEIYMFCHIFSPS
jgi:hypothetical protein